MGRSHVASVVCLVILSLSPNEESALDCCNSLDVSSVLLGICEAEGAAQLVDAGAAGGVGKSLPLSSTSSNHVPTAGCEMAWFASFGSLNV